MKSGPGTVLFPKLVVGIQLFTFMPFSVSHSQVINMPCIHTAFSKYDEDYSYLFF